MHPAAWYCVPLLLASMFVLSWKKLPYFPIEISHAMASSVAAKAVIKIVSPSLYVLCQNRHDKAAWLCFVIIAYFDDVSYWTVHMLGVWGLGVVTFFTVSGTRSVAVASFALGLYIGRAFSRYFAVWLLEGVPLLQVHWRVREIEHWGRAHPVVLLVFRFAGFVQWVIVLMLLSLYTQHDELRDIAHAWAAALEK